MKQEVFVKQETQSRFSPSHEALTKARFPIQSFFQSTALGDIGATKFGSAFLDSSSSSDVIHQRMLQTQKQTVITVTNKSIEEELFDAKLACKMAASLYTNKILNWRSELFKQIDYLMEAEDWEKDDAPVSEESFKTLLRLLTLKDVKRRPGLGATYSGNAIASWVSQKGDRVIVTCFENDLVEWVVSVTSNGEVDTASGRNKLSNFFERISGHVDKSWFSTT